MVIHIVQPVVTIHGKFIIIQPVHHDNIHGTFISTQTISVLFQQLLSLYFCQDPPREPYFHGQQSLTQSYINKAAVLVTSLQVLPTHGVLFRALTTASLFLPVLQLCQQPAFLTHGDYINSPEPTAF